MADDYSAFSKPVADDYSSFSAPVAEKTADPYEGIATPVSEVPQETETDKLAKKVKEAAPNLRKVPVGSSLSMENLKRGLGLLFNKASPWERYKQSVDQAFETALPEVHRYQTDPNDPTALKVAAGVENTVNSAAAGVVSPGGVSSLNPITAPAAILYSTPRFIASGVEALRNVGRDKSAQENVENVLGGGLGLLGGVAGGVHGIKGARAQVPQRVVVPEAVKPKGPTIVEQMDSSTSGTPTAANVSANEIAMKSPEPVPAPNPSDVALDKINKGIIDAATLDQVVPGAELPKSAPITETKVGTVSRTDKANYEEYIAHKKVFEKAIEEHLADPTNPEIEARFQKAFAKNEEIKNRNGGYAPEPPVEGAFDIADFTKEWEKSGKESGSENQILFKDGKVYKRNYNEKLGEVLPNYRTMEAFQENLALHNEIFPETQLNFEGISKTKDGDAPVVSQVEVKGTTPTKAEIDAFMAKKGFEPYSKTAYINKEAGIRVGDLKGDNVIKDADGVIHVIDPIIKRVEAEVPKPRDLGEAKGYIDELLATREITPEEHAAQLAELGIKPEVKSVRPIKEAANVMPDFKVITGEYHEAIRAKAKEMGYSDADIAKSKEGFVTQKGDWVSREEAAKLLGSKKRTMTAERMKMEGMKSQAKPIEVPRDPIVQAVTNPPFEIPKELSKSSPRYKTHEVIFDDPLDKALYVIAQDAKRSARDADFLNLVMEHTGMSEAEARAAGKQVRDRIKTLATDAEEGLPLTLKKNAVQKQSAERLPVRQQAQAGEEVGSQVRSQGQEVQEQVAQKTSAKNPEPSVVEPLVSDPALQKLADDVEVAGILRNDDGSVPPETGKKTANSDDPGYRPGLTKYGLGIGKAAEFFKVAAGTIEGNIRDASKAIFGVLRNYEYAKSQLSMKLEQATMPASRLARKILTKEGNDIVGNLLMSGKVDEAKALVAKYTRYGEQFAKAIDDVRAALDYAHQLSTEARGEVPYLKDYFPRQLIDYAEFRKFLGKDEVAAADAAIKRAQDRSETPLTREQIDAAINDLISQSRRAGGKPGYLKGRTIAEIDANISKFYEPWDVALENYLRKVTNDVVNRSYFGKVADGGQWNPAGGSLGKAINDEIAAGRLSGKAQNIVIDNLQDRFSYENAARGISAEIGRKIRFAQSAAFLGQLGTALAQFGDVYGSILHQGPIDTALGYVPKRVAKALGMQEKLGLRDIGIHEGNVETAQFSRRKGAIDKAADLTVKFGVGLSDQFNKGGVANAIRRHYADIMMKPDSAAYARLNRDYSRKFPTQWPKMLKELRSKEFQNGNIKNLPEAQFFLYNEIADIHPINPSGMAQGFNAAHPLAKPLWGLKSYMIKQLDIMRARGYEKIKDPRSRYEGLGYLAAYAAIVAGAQNFSISWLRDHLSNRDADTSDYFVGGFLQPLGLSRYTINTLRKGEVGKALTESLLPIVSLGRETINDLALTRDMIQQRRDKETRRRTVKDLGDLVSQSELVKHFPVIGSLYYSRAGKGADNEKKRREQKAKGRGQLNTVETISDIIQPAETAAR